MAELDLKDESDKSVLARLVRRIARLLSGNGCKQNCLFIGKGAKLVRVGEVPSEKNVFQKLLFSA